MINLCNVVSSSDEKTNDVIKGLLTELDQIAANRAKAAGDKESELEEIRREKDLLRDIFIAHPNLFKASFEAGVLDIDPVSFDFKEDHLSWCCDSLICA